MAIKKVVTLDIKANSKEADKALESIQEDLVSIEKQSKKTFSGDNAEKLTKELKKTDDAAKSVKTRLRELEDELADIGDVNSPQFQKLAKEAGVLRDKMNNAKAAVKSLSSDFPKLQVGTQAFQAVGGAAQGAMGAAALFGDENEAVTKSLQKLMAAQSILNSVNTVANALSDETALGLKVRTALGKIKTANELKSAGTTKALTLAQKGLTVATWLGNGAMKALNVVMNANPVMLIIAGITALIAAFKIFGSETEDVDQMNKDLNSTLKAQNRIFSESQKQLQKVAENRRKELELNDATEKEFHQDTLKRLREEEQARKRELQILKGGLDNRQRLYDKARRTEDDELARSIGEQIRADKTRIAELRRNEQDYDKAKRKEIKNFNEWKADEDKKAADEEKAKLKERNDNYKAFLKEREAAEKNLENLRADAIKDEEKQKLEKARLAFERELEALKGTEAQKGEAKKLITERYEQEIIDIKRSFLDEELELRALDTANDLEHRNMQITNAINAEEIKTENRRIHREKRTQEEQEEADARFEIAKQSFQLIAAVADLFAGRSEKAARIAFNINKAANIAQATMDGYRAVLSTYAQTPGGVVIKGIAAGLAGGFAAVQVANIAQTQFQGGGSGNLSTPSIPSSGGATGGGGNVANFNVVGNTGVNQLAETLGDKEQAPIKAFVVGSDVTTQQSLDRNKVETATL